MGVIDEFKQEKNKKIIITASKKMIEDKYKMTINDNDLLIIINNIVSSICCDAILMKNIGKLIELNTIALTKIKDYIEKYIINKSEETLYQQETPIEKELLNNKFETEDLLSKVLELEEKRKTLNLLVNLDNVKENEQNIINIATNAANANANANANFSNSKFPLINKNTSNMTADNIELIAYIIEKMENIINNKKNVNYKNLIINSYNRDWNIYESRNDLSLSINIDLNKNIIEPKKILMPKYVKNLTPYINMIIDDTKKIQKYQFILSNLSNNNGHWDTWEIINNEFENLNNTINLNNRDWIISFTDYLNNKLNLGTDNINIVKISKTIEDNQYNITIDKKDIVLFKEYYIEYNNSYDNILLKTNEEEDIILKIIEINNNIIKVFSDKNLEEYVEGTLLNYKAQYSIILQYHAK
jgi:hypothetical protein